MSGCSELRTRPMMASELMPEDDDDGTGMAEESCEVAAMEGAGESWPVK